MIKNVQIQFSGSFQARLATDNDATGSSPTDPDGVYGTASQGWTYCYKEPHFDRIIRLSNPVSLRDALIDPWEDTAVTQIAVERDAPKWVTEAVTHDILVGEIVSLGSAKFDSSKSGITTETLIDFDFSLGFALTADTKQSPQLRGVTKAPTDWATEYKGKKPSLVATIADPIRKKLLDSSRIEDLASFFQLYDPIHPVGLENVVIKRPMGILKEIDDAGSTRFNWILDLAFFRFDGDTLTGRCEGAVTAKLSSP